jgi:hypothetical protein
MALNFNTTPYYDDFDPNKNFHRILFKPGFAVQARELTQSQTILQDQISKFASHVFQKNTPISGGNLTYNTGCFYVKLQSTINGAAIDVDLFDKQLIQNANGNVIAKVLAVAPAIGGDPDTIVVSYVSGSQFQDNDLIYAVDDPNISAQAITLNATGYSSVASISEGVFYVVNGFSLSQITNTKYSIGHFVNVLPQTTILDKYSTTPNVRVGLNITETVYDYINDVSLLDPADGSPNYQGPGADRYVINLDLQTRPLQLGDDQDFIELMRIEDGQIKKQVDSTVYATIDDYFAKRTFDTNGDYVVKDFKLTPSSNTANSSLYDLTVGKGVAYVRGYRLENQSDIKLTSNRARTTETLNNNSTFIEYGNYLLVDSANGVFDVTTMPSIDLHVVDKADIATTNATTYAATVAATARIRGLEFDYYTNMASIPTYVYKAYLTDIQNKTLTANAVSATSSNITFPGLGFSATANAYYNVTLSIDNGTSSGDVKRIVTYNGTTRTATVDTPFTVTPDTTSKFTLRFDTKDVESMIRVSSGTTISAWASINDTSGKIGGLVTGDTLLQSKVAPELIYNLGNPFAASIADASYQTTQVFRNVAFNGSSPTTTPTINLPSAKMQFLGTSHENYIVINQTTGQIVSFANPATRSITLSNSNKSLVLQATDLSSFVATIIVKAAVTDATDSNQFLKIKNLINANTSAVNLSGTTINSNIKVDLGNGQTYIKTAALVTPGQSQLLYVSDVKRIVKIIDTKNSVIVPSNSMLTDPLYDVTQNFSFDNGQTDGYYGHASIKLLPGKPKPTGQLLVLFDYYQHTGGDGYFSVMSYLAPKSTSPEAYGQIPNYVAKNGNFYNLRDSLDFRPKVKNAQTAFVFDYTTDPATTNAGIYVPLDNSIFIEDYSYYLGRKDKLILTKDKNFEIVEGTPSINPILPVEPDGSLVIANLILDPYSNYVPGEAPKGFLPNLSVERVQHRRWTMQDISNLQYRVNNIEYYTALNNLEKNAQSLQIPDVNGLNRFKNGILVDDFSSYATADTNNVDFNAAINRRERKLTAAHKVDNFPLQNQYLVASSNRLNTQSANTLGFKVNVVGQTNLFTLPYTTANLVSQPLASNTVNINPFGTPIAEGVMGLNPPMDNWVDNTRQPDLLIVDPNLQIYQSSNTLNSLSVGDWKVIPGTTSSSSSAVATTSSGRNWSTTSTTTTTQTFASLSQSSVLGFYDKLGSSYSTQNGYITDISILPFIRPQQLAFKANGLLMNTPLSAWFDGVSVDKYITSPDTIELTNVSGSFAENDIIGYMNAGTFYPLASVISVYNYPGTTNVRLYIIGNNNTSYNYTEFTNSKIQNGTFNSTGAYVGTTASGTIPNSNVVSIHKSGLVSTVGGTFTDADSTTTQLVRATNPAYSPLLNRYGVWWADGRNPGTVSFNVNFATAGTYTFYFSADNYGSMSIDGVAKITLTGSTVSNYSTEHTASVVVTAGTHKITLTAQNTGGPASFYGLIRDSLGQSVFNTVDALWTYQPSQSGVMAQITGGGLYFTGVTKMTLSSIASSVNDFYIGNKIKINSVFVSFNSLTNEQQIIPTTYTATITNYVGSTRTLTLNTPVNISMGFNSRFGGDITSSYSIDGSYTSYKLAIAAGNALPSLCSDEAGNFVGILNIPANTFKTGERVFRVDNRLSPTNVSSATTFAEATFTASGLSTKSQAIEFAPSIDSAKRSFTQTSYKSNQLISTSVSTSSVTNTWDPVAQTFIVDAANYPNGTFLNSIKLFFASKPTTTNTPVTLSIVGTQNGYPNGDTLPHSIVTKAPADIKVAGVNDLHKLNPNSYTEFVFEAPVYIQPGVLYAFIVKSISTEYNLYIASQNSTAYASTVKNLPTDVTPTNITKIGTAPYIGSLFESQNAITWTANQGKSLMFGIERCKFDINKAPKLPFIIPAGLPYRKLTSQEVRTFYDANNVSNLFNVVSGRDISSDAYNITTTDFIPSGGSIAYTYKSTLNDSNKTVTNEYPITPGKYGCPTYDDIYLNDGLGERLLIANSNTSFVAYATLKSSDDTISPIISDDGLSLFNIQWNINNMELSNSLITIVDSGTGYNANTISVTVSPPDDIDGTQAYAVANLSGNTISTINFINPGSGYLTTPTITILDPTTRSGNANASIVVYGESSSSGGNGVAKYFTKKVVLTPTNDSGDLRVFYTAYRPLGTNISVYYKILNRNDTQSFENSSWQLMTPVTNTRVYSQSRSDTYEFEVAPGTNFTPSGQVSYTNLDGQTFTTFSQFAIKIVLSSKDKTTVPFLTDIRALALPSGTGF